jgi:hypothetical protein
VTKVTTAALLVGPKYIGPFADSDCWRIGLTVQVVDGGSNGPYLHCVLPGKPELTIPWHGFEPLAGNDALLLAISLFSGDSLAIGLLLQSHNVTVHGDELLVAEFYELTPELRRRLTDHFQDAVKIAWVKLSPDSSFSDELAGSLAADGFLIQAFSALE